MLVLQIALGIVLGGIMLFLLVAFAEDVGKFLVGIVQLGTLWLLWAPSTPPNLLRGRSDTASRLNPLSWASTQIV
jgi:hypothetical protein